MRKVLSNVVGTFEKNTTKINDAEWLIRNQRALSINLYTEGIKRHWRFKSSSRFECEWKSIVQS